MAIAKKKQKFFDVEMPILNKTTQLYAFSTEELNGRIIKYDLTRMLRGKNAIILLDVIADKDSATSTAREFKILPTFLRKMVRKGTSYAEDSFSTECKDAIIKFKPLLIARRKVSRAVRKELRNRAKEEIIKYAKTKTAQDIFKEVLKNQMQKPLSLKLKKTYPLSLCEIRVLKIEKKLDKKKPAEKKPTKKESEKPEKEKSEEKEKPKDKTSEEKIAETKE